MPWRSRAKLSPSLHPPPSGSRGGQVLVPSVSITCRYSGKRSASGRRRHPCGQGLCRCGYVVKAQPCPHIHAVSALVHQAQDWRGRCSPVLEGGGGGRFPGKPCGPVGGRAGEALHDHRPAGPGLVSVSTTCRNPLSSYHELWFFLMRVWNGCRMAPKGAEWLRLAPPPMVITGRTFKR